MKNKTDWQVNKHKILLLTALLVVFFRFVVTSPVLAQIQDWDSGDPQTSCVVDGVPTLECLEIVYSNILYVSSTFVLIVLFIMIVYGAFVYMTSMGNATKITQGSNILKWSFIGLGVFIASYVILFIIDVAFLGGKGDIFRLDIPGPGD